MLNPPASTQTKAEILKAFEQLSKEYAELEKKLGVAEKQQAALESELKNTRKAGPSLRPAESEKTPPVKIPRSFQQMIEQLTALEAGLSSAVSDLSADLMAESTKLSGIRNTIAKEIAASEALHHLQIGPETLNELIRKYQEMMVTFDAELSRKKTDFEAEFAQKKQGWQKELTDHSKKIKERDDQTKSLSEREQDEYKYNLDLTRKLEAEAYVQQQNLLLKELEKFETDTRRERQEHEKALAEQEQAVAEAQKRVENFPKELESAVKQARQAAREKALKAVKIQANLEAKKIEGEKRIAELRVKSLEEVVSRQTAQIEAISKKLDGTLMQAQDLATKAIEGASNIDSLKAMKQIALEQAKKIVQNK
jgi:chromosome segregation ATPase